MRIVRSARLWFQGGTSDKVYEVDLLENDGLAGGARFLVNFRYGRRGASLREGTKTNSPVAREAAEKIFDSVVVSKVNEGYRRTDEPAAVERAPTVGASGGEASVGGRERELLSRLEACLASPWAPKERDRLLWRIGEVRIRAATPSLVALAGRMRADASYSLVFALARCGGAEAAATLRTIAQTASSQLARNLAGFALVSPMMGEAREPVELDASYPETLVRARQERDPDRIVGALSELAANATQNPARALDVGRALVALGRAAQGDAELKAALAHAIPRLPARPPYLVGLRKLYKYAEMADDAVLFGATAQRFETATPMYKSGLGYGGQVYVPELRRRVRLTDVQGTADASVGLADATLRYFKRRIWRTLRKRGELGQPSFAELGAAYLLAIQPADLGQRLTWTHFVYGEGGQWSREPRASGPLSKNWTASQLLQRNDPQAKPRSGSLSFIELPQIPAGPRPEAFPELWEARPDLGLRLAAESPIWPVAMLGIRVLKANAGFVSGLSASDLGRLLASPHAEVLQLAFEEARDRLARGAGDDDLLVALLGADLPEARRLAAERIEREPALPWSSASLAFATLTAAHADLAEPILRWARERKLRPGVAEPLARRVAEWLLSVRGSPLGDASTEPAPTETLSLVGRGRVAPLGAPGEGGPSSPDSSLALPSGAQPSPLRGPGPLGASARSASPTRPLPNGERVSHPSDDTIRLVRARLRLLWADRTMPLSAETVQRLMAHPMPAVAAAGIDILGLTGTDPATITDATWRELLGSPSEDVQKAALALFGGLSDEELGKHAPLIAAFATSSSTKLRQAARPLVARIAARDPALADRLARELIDTLFSAAPDDAYPADTVALLREAMPNQLAALDEGMVWRLLQARAKGAQLLGAELLPQRQADDFSVRQTARLGNHAHLAVRQWAMAAFEANPARFQDEAQDAVLLVETEWPEVYDFARRTFDGWPPEAWTPQTLAVVTDSVKPEVLDFARHLLRSRLRPADAEAQLTRLLEHPAQSMHLLVTEMLTQEAAQSDDAFAKLVPLSRIVMLQVLKGRVAKDRMAAFLKSEALRSRFRAMRIAPLFAELTLSGTERDRAEAVIALRDIGETHPGLAEVTSVPMTRIPPPRRSMERAAR